MFEQNNFATPNMGGYAYQGMAQPMVKFNNPLTPEEIKQLQQKGNQFSLGLTDEDILRASCNHRNAEGTGDTLTFDPVTQEARCTICGYKFRPIEASCSQEDIKQDVDRLVDILQTIKLMYIDLPANAAKDFFPIIALLEKVPQLFEFAAKNMSLHECFNWQYNNKNMGAVNMFNNLQNIFGGMGGYNPAMAQQAPMGAPMGMGMPQQAPMGYPGANGFGFPGAMNGMPNPAMGGYTPATNGFQYVPGQGTIPTAPSTPAVPVPSAPAPQQDDVTVTQKVTV